MKQKDNYSKQFLLLFISPLEHGITHESIKEILKNYNVKFWCLSDMRQNFTGYLQATHVYILFDDFVYIKRVKKEYPHAYIIPLHQDFMEIYNYIKHPSFWDYEEISLSPSAFIQKKK